MSTKISSHTGFDFAIFKLEEAKAILTETQGLHAALPSLRQEKEHLESQIEAKKLVLQRLTEQIAAKQAELAAAVAQDTQAASTVNTIQESNMAGSMSEPSKDPKNDRTASHGIEDESNRHTSHGNDEEETASFFSDTISLAAVSVSTAGSDVSTAGSSSSSKKRTPNRAASYRSPKKWRRMIRTNRLQSIFFD